jgi:hypothetical protein
LGAPCNGCGVCCLAEPCPVGMLASRRRSGSCTALEWEGDSGPYRCGLLRAPSLHLFKRTLPWLDPLLRRWSRRWIAAGIGCDAPLDVQAPDKP